MIKQISVIVILIIITSSIGILPQSSWQLLGLNGKRIYTLVPDSSGNIYAGTDAGLAKIKTNNTIENLAATANFFDVPSMIFCPTTNLLIASNEQFLMTSKDGGDTWATIPTTSNFGLFTLGINTQGTCFAANPVTGILRSTDGGITWDSVSNFSGGLSGMLISKPGYIFGGISPGIVRSKNSRQTWDTIPSMIYYTNCFGMNKVTGTLFIGIDAITNTSSRALTYRSTDEGDTWKLIDTTGTNIDAIYGAANGILYAGKGEVYRSTDDGITWTKYGTGLPSNVTMQISALAERNGVIYAGDRNFGLYAISSTLTGIRNDQRNDLSYKLNQNYPNPFNPVTTINYSIGKEGYTKITVYNILGSRADVLVDENKSAGSHSVQFNASALPSGVYFYKLESGGYSDIKKLILMK
jgi:photosystem II stability/assembly factor-like uncharacterized protein